MNKTIKYAAPLAILSLFIIGISQENLGKVDAIKTIDESESLPDSQYYYFPTLVLVCQNPPCSKIASEIEPKALDEKENQVRTTAKKESSTSADSNDGPYAKIIGMTIKGMGLYQVIIRVYAGEEDLLEGDVLLTSDVFKKKEIHRKVEAGSFVTVKTKMRADDPHTISVELLKREQTYEPPICYQRSKCHF